MIVMYVVPAFCSLPCASSSLAPISTGFRFPVGVTEGGGDRSI